MDDHFTFLKEKLIAECKQTPVYFFQNKGNWGDALIRQGTISFLNDIGIKYKELTRQKKDWVLPFLKGGTLIYGGGGAWCKYWDRSKTVKKLSRRFKLIILPSTYEKNFKLKNTTFFCRDRFESKKNIPESYFCHDMAFYINKACKNKTKFENGFFFRTDKETANTLSIPSNNNDISKKGNHLSNTDALFNEINRYHKIYTDRLHVSIAGALLKKEVHLYPNAYFKNKAIYKSSIKGYYENFYFHEQFDFKDTNHL